MDYFRIQAPDLAIDIGSAQTRAMRMDNHKAVEEPSVVALDYKKMQIVAVGEEAKALLGKAPENIVAIRPLQHGVISDYDLTRALLEHYIRRLIPGVTLLAPRLTIAVPSGATDVEQRALQDACLQSGVREAFLVEESLAAAYGARQIRSATRGALMLNIGAGTTEVAVVNSYGVITAETMKRGGQYLDQAILQLIRDKYNLMVGENTAEKIKITIGSLRDDRQNDAMEVGGRDILSGMPKSSDIYASDVTEAMLPYIRELLDRLRLTLEKTPPELSRDIMEKGVILTGGGAQIDGLCEYITRELHIHASLSAHPAQDTLLGCGYIMEHIQEWTGKGARHDSDQKD